MSQSEQIFSDGIRRYALERVLPDYARWDRGEQYPRERVLAELGINGLRVPIEYGGWGASYVMSSIAAFELGRGGLGRPGCISRP